MEDAPDELTAEEELLAALLDANEALMAALQMYDDLARVATERATEEKSKKEVRMDRRVSVILFRVSLVLRWISAAIK